MALFAALSYAVTQSGRGGGNIDREQEELDLAVNEQCIGSVEYGVNKLKVLNNCPDAEVSYELPNGLNENANNPSDTSCFVFHEDGGDITPCGSFLELSITTGNITMAGDTSTIVLLSGGSFLTCPSWSGDQCNFALSNDGTNFVAGPPGNRICYHRGDGSDPARAGSTFRNNFLDMVCLSACGGTPLQYGGAGSNPVTHYIEDDFSVTPYTGTCANILNRARCGCW